MRELRSKLVVLALLGAMFLSVSVQAQTEKKPIADYTSITALINHYNYLPADYEPQDLVIPKVPRQTYNDTTAKMRREAASALEALYAAAEAEGHYFFNVSGYRPYSMQKEIFDEEVARSGYEIAALYIAIPGCSEHQSGLAMDVSSGRMGGGLYASFGDTPEGMWLADNCHTFGFVIRYARDKEAVTKIAYEPWHLRYVGKTLAARLKAENLALEEYYALPAKYNMAKFRIHDEVQQRAAYNIKGNNFFRLRDIAELLMDSPSKFDIKWSEEKRLAEITRGGDYSENISAQPKTDGLSRAIRSNKLEVEIDGERKELYGYLIDGYNYFKLRDLQLLFNYRVEWDNEAKVIDLLLPSLQ